LVRLPSNGAAHAATGSRMWSPPGSEACAKDAAGTDLSGAEHLEEASAPQGLVLLTERPKHQLSQPGLVRRHHLHSDEAWDSLSRSDHGLIQPEDPGLATIELYGGRFWHRNFDNGRGQA